MIDKDHPGFRNPEDTTDENVIAGFFKRPVEIDLEGSIRPSDLHYMREYALREGKHERQFFLRVPAEDGKGWELWLLTGLPTKDDLDAAVERYVQAKF